MRISPIKQRRLDLIPDLENTDLREQMTLPGMFHNSHSHKIHVETATSMTKRQDDSTMTMLESALLKHNSTFSQQSPKSR